MFPQKNFVLDSKNPRNIDINPPKIYGEDNSKLKRIKENQIEADSINHQKRESLYAFYVEQIDSLISLDTLDSRLIVQDLNCKLKGYIYPYEGGGK